MFIPDGVRSMGKAKFTVECPERSFSRSVSVPMDCRGYAEQLAEDLEKCIRFYEMKDENHRFKQAHQLMLTAVKFLEAEYEVNPDLKNLLDIINGVKFD